MATKASFREPFRRRRCLILVDAFYEWPRRGTRREKEPYVIRRADEAPLVLAGLWDVWRRREEVIMTCAIITTEANALVRTIPHDRMPVILEPPEFDAWLDPSTPLDQVQAMLAPAPDGVLTMWRVSTRVNTGAHDDPPRWESLEMGSAD